MKLIIDIEPRYCRDMQSDVKELYYEAINRITEAVRNGKPYDERSHCDLISRSYLKQMIPAPIEDEYKRVHRIIDNAPAVEAYTFEDLGHAEQNGYQWGVRDSERPQGEWEHDKLFGECAYVCSFCHTIWTSSEIQNMHYCPTCGADMKGDKK